VHATAKAAITTNAIIDGKDFKACLH